MAISLYVLLENRPYYLLTVTLLQSHLQRLFISLCSPRRCNSPSLSMANGAFEVVEWDIRVVRRMVASFGGGVCRESRQSNIRRENWLMNYYSESGAYVVNSLCKLSAYIRVVLVVPIRRESFSLDFVRVRRLVVSIGLVPWVLTISSEVKICSCPQRSRYCVCLERIECLLTVSASEGLLYSSAGGSRQYFE